ncbi:MAG: purine-nucleoside phosphorylase [Ignavibacteriales bacterium]|nr:purine-nucleoside phosphorylase [Ignavibacteriales bacterium]
MRQDADIVTNHLRNDIGARSVYSPLSDKNLIKKKNIQEAFRFIRSVTDFKPRLALILGSGLGGFSKNIRVVSSILASEIPNYPVSSVQGHAGKLLFGYLQKDSTQSMPLLVFQGRVHFYESGSLDQVVFPVILAHQIGIRKLIITNAAGGLNSCFSAGDLMLIQDIINLTFLQHHSKSNGRSFSTYTPNVYFDQKMQQTVLQCAAQIKIPMQQGTYCWLKGPSYETPAEIQMLKLLGVDAVGMSTVPELYTSCSLGMKTIGISLISNLAAGISQNKLSHAEVTETANNVKERFSELLEKIILSIN